MFSAAAAIAPTSVIAASTTNQKPKAPAAVALATEGRTPSAMSRLYIP
jgi:hypothetical protein